MATTLGIDIGTTTVSAIVLDTETGRRLRGSTLVHLASLPGSSPGRQDWGKIRSCLKKVIHSLVLPGEDILKVDGIAVTGQMHGCLFLNKAGSPVSPLFTWEDRSSLLHPASGRSWLAQFRGLFEKTTEPDSAPAPASGYMGVTLFTLGQTGEIPAEAVRCAFVHDLAVSELLEDGDMNLVTDPSFAQSSGLYLLPQKTWNTPLMEAAEIDPGLLPTVLDAGSPIGTTGMTDYPLLKGIPVFTGLGDNQASFLGSCRHPDDTVLLNVGTGGQLSLLITEYDHRDGMETRVWTGSDFLLVGAALCAGKAYSLLKEFIAVIGKTFFSGEKNDADLYRLMESAAVGTTDLQCQPTFSGTRLQPNTAGSLRNITEENFSIGHLITAVARGIAEELHDYYLRAGIPKTSLAASGGAVRKSTVIREALGCIFGIKLRIPVIEEEAALGAALTAAVGAGLFRDFREAAGVVTYVP